MPLGWYRHVLCVHLFKTTTTTIWTRIKTANRPFAVVYFVAKPLIWTESDPVVIETSIYLAWQQSNLHSKKLEKQQGLYHNKVNLSLTPVQRLGNQAHNCKKDHPVWWEI